PGGVAPDAEGRRGTRAGDAGTAWRAARGQDAAALRAHEECLAAANPAAAPRMAAGSWLSRGTDRGRFGNDETRAAPHRLDAFRFTGGGAGPGGPEHDGRRLAGAAAGSGHCPETGPEAILTRGCS